MGFSAPEAHMTTNNTKMDTSARRGSDASSCASTASTVKSKGQKKGKNDGCFKCGKPGHIARDCDACFKCGERGHTAVMCEPCYGCGEFGHKISACPKLTNAWRRDRWVISTTVEKEEKKQVKALKARQNEARGLKPEATQPVTRKQGADQDGFTTVQRKKG